jgi:hypothetical protein
MRTDEQLKAALGRPEERWPGEPAAYELVLRRRTGRMRRTSAAAGLALVAMLALGVWLRPGGPWATRHVPAAGTASSNKAPDRAVDCRPPRDERSLRGAYAHDPMLAFSPPGAEPTSGIRTDRACIELPDGPPTRTEAYRGYRSTAGTPVDGAMLSSIYGSLAARQGWSPAGPDPLEWPPAKVRYCKQVRGVTTYLELVPNVAVAPGLPESAEFAVSIVAYPEQAACHLRS